MDALTDFRDNQTGQLCRVFMITGAGAEGLSLKNVRRVHIMEPYWNKVRTDQVQGRAIRICSHMELPYDPNPILNQRKVDVYTYISVFPEGAEVNLNETIKKSDISPEGKIVTTDQFIYALAGRKEALSKDFLTITQQMAVDCPLNVTENKVDCLGIRLAREVTKSDFFYDPRLDKDLGTEERVRFETKKKTPIEEAGGTKVVAGVGAKEKTFWVLKRQTEKGILYDLYDEANTNMETIKVTATQSQYDKVFRPVRT